MPGPLPKPDDLRRRRNLEGKASRLERRQGEPPPIGARRGDLEWDDEVLDWWDRAWRSQMASRWHEAEINVVRRYCDLYQSWLDLLNGDRIFHLSSKVLGSDAVRVLITVETSSTTLLAGMVAIEDRLGLSPVSRRRLNWELDDDNDSAAPEPKTGKARARRNDPRLRAIPGGRTKGTNKSP